MEHLHNRLECNMSFPPIFLILMLETVRVPCPIVLRVPTEFHGVVVDSEPHLKKLLNFYANDT